MAPNLPLEPARPYRVRIRNQPRTVRRIFKWTEKRFGDIPCFVFTAQVGPTVRAHWNPERQSLHLQGPRLPRSEVSVPHYDLLECRPA